MLMQRSLCVVLIIIVTCFSCATPVIKEVSPPATGFVQTPEWVAYNDQAKIDNLPNLDYFVICKDTADFKAQGVTDVFDLKDERVCFLSKWSNVFNKELYTIRVFDPRNVEFEKWDVSYQYDGPNWNIRSSLYIKDAPASRLPGKWRVRLFMHDTLAVEKEFVIGNTDREYQEVSLGPDVGAIACLPFLTKGECSGRYDDELPEYMAQMFLIDFADRRSLFPWDFRKEISITQYDDVDDLADGVMNSKIFADLAERENIDIFILGAALDDCLVGEPKLFHIYVIDAKNKTIVEDIKTRWESSSYYSSGYLTGKIHLEACKSVYKTFMKKAEKDIKKVLYR